MRHALPALALSALAAVAQTPPQTLDLERVEVPWPAAATGPFSYTGADRGIACGAFLAGYDARAVLIARGDAVYMSFQPAIFDSIVGALPRPLAAGDELIGTLPALAGGGDRLAAVTTDGLEIWAYDELNGAFEQIGPAVPQFLNATTVRTGSFGPTGAQTNYVLGFAPGWVRGALVDAADVVYPGPKLSMPAGVQVLDAVAVDWEPGGLPELAALTTTGVFVVRVDGSPVATLSMANAAGKLCKVRSGSAIGVTAVVPSGAQWRLRTWMAPGGATFDTVPFSMAGTPIGIVSIDKDGDLYQDVVVSATDSVRRVFSGSPVGPVAHSGRLDLLDVRPATLPANPPANPLPLVVDDIDRNGINDLVIQSTAGNRVVVLRDVRPQIYALTSDGEPPPDPDVTVGTAQVLGQLTSLTAAEDQWMFDGVSVDAFDALPLRIPIPVGFVPGSSLQVFVYELDPSDPNEGFESAPSGWFTYALPNDAGGLDFDVLVPVPRWDVLPLGGSYKVGLEYNLVAPNGHSSASRLAEHEVYSEPPKDTPGMMQLLAELNPTWEELWIVLATGVSSAEWLDDTQLLAVGQHFTAANPPTSWDNRYIGLHPATRKLPKGVKLPKLPPNPTPQSNGQVRGD